MKHIKLYEDFVNEASSLNKIKSLIPGVKLRKEEIEFDPEEDYKSVESYSFEIPGVDEPAYINIYDGNSFCFFYDAAPIALSLHTSSEKNEMAQSQMEIPKPLNKLNKKIYDEAVADIKEYVGESAINEATTSWKKMMQGVRASETGPWSIVAIQDRKVVGQSIDIRIQDLIPAKYEALKKEFPKAKLHIEDGTGMVVWNESYINEAKFKVGDKWEWHHVDGVKTVEITNVKSNGDVVGREDGSSEDFIVRDANKYLKKKVNESFINEAKTLTRDEMMATMRNKYGLSFVKTTEEFDGEKGGIWLGGSDGKLMPNAKDDMFNYYHGGSKYPQGVHKDLAKFLDKCGWYGQFADPGTVMLWPKGSNESIDITHTKDSDTLAGNPGEDERMLNVRAFRGTVADLTSFVNDKIGK